MGAAPYVGPVYGTQPNPMILTQPGGYNVGGMSNYGSQPVQQMSGSQGIPNQGIGQIPSTYAASVPPVTGYQYSSGTIPSSR